MSDIILKPLPLYEHTFLSNHFIDTHMPAANGEYVKVYIYMLRLITAGTSEVTIGKVAKQLNLIRSDVLRAINYWRDKHLMEVTYVDDIITTIGFLNHRDHSAPTASVDGGKSDMVREEIDEKTPRQKEIHVRKKRQARLTERPQYSMEEMALYEEQEEFKQLIYIASSYLKKPLTQQDVNTLLGFIDWLGLPIDVVEYLVEYCTDNGHRNMRYIETVAMDWSDRNIHTVEQAKASSESFNRNYYSIFKALGIGNRQPTPKQIALMDKWVKDYNFAIEVIELACEKTIAAINKPEMSYVDKILSTWNNKGVKSITAIEELDKNFKAAKEAAKGKDKKPATKNRFHNHEQREYDYEDLEEKMDVLLDKRIEDME